MILEFFALVLLFFVLGGGLSAFIRSPFAMPVPPAPPVPNFHKEINDQVMALMQARREPLELVIGDDVPLERLFPVSVYTFGPTKVFPSHANLVYHTFIGSLPVRFDSTKTGVVVLDKFGRGV